MGFISPLTLFRMQLVWAGVTSGREFKGTSWGQASPRRCFLLSREQRLDADAVPEGVPRLGSPELAV